MNLSRRRALFPGALGLLFPLPFLLSTGVAPRSGGASVPGIEGGIEAAPEQQDPALQSLAEGFAKLGVYLDLDAEVCAIPASIRIRDDLLEYLATMPHGAAHEALFLVGEKAANAEDAQVWAQALNTALLTLGVQPGKNAERVEKDPAPTLEEQRAGASRWDVRPPEGDGFYLYAAWKEGSELFLYRVEDLIRDLDSSRAMRRQRWVFLGSRMLERPGGEVGFAAGVEGNLVNISFFPQGNTLITASLPECLNQTTWLPNAWLLPPEGSPVLLVFSRRRLSELPEGLMEKLPDLGAR